MRSKMLKSVFLGGAFLFWLSVGHSVQAQTIRVKGVHTLLGNSGRVAWSTANNIIAYDQMGKDGYYQLWTINPDGSNNKCLTCGTTPFPALNKGNPIWSPDGKFIVFQAEMTGTGNGVTDFIDFPGSGWNNDLWATDAAGSTFWRLTNVAAGSGGVICPTFSWDGKTLVWGQRLSTEPTPFGSWEIAVASFNVSSNGTPSVSNIHYYTPGTNHYYYEPHGFSLDNQTLFFMGNLDPGMVLKDAPAMNVYSFNLTTGALNNLTNTLVDWNEYPISLPGANKIVYMSTTQTGRNAQQKCEADLWIMNYDGSDKDRLTFYNDPNSPTYVPIGACLDTHQFNAGANELVVFSNNLPVYNYHLNGATPGEAWILDIELAADTVNGASALHGAAPGTVVSAFGPNLASQTASAPGQPLPTNLAGNTVTVTDAKGNTNSAGLYFVSPGQVNAVIPPGTAPGPATLQFNNSSGGQIRATVPIAGVAPGLFTMNQNGKGAAAGYVQVVSGGAQSSVPVYNCSAGAGNCTTNPVNVSNSSNQYFLTLFGTGFRGRSSLQAVSVQIGNQTLPVIFAGPQGQYDALDQLNVQLPSSLAGAGTVNVVVTVDGVAANTVQIQVQ